MQEECKTCKSKREVAEMSYDEWLEKVALEISRVYGSGVADFMRYEICADWPSRDTFDSGTAPVDAVEIWAEWQDGLPMPDEMEEV